MTVISVVVPVYQCAGCLTELNSRLITTLEKITSQYEIIYVDDRAKDNAWKIIAELAQNNERIKGIKLSRNFGQHIAITAGLEKSQGDWVVVLDCDLQDPPEEIIRLYENAMTGFDIVYTKRIRKKHSLYRRILSSMYFKLMTKISDQFFNPELGSFTIISRKVVTSFLKFKDNDRHYLFILYWLGYNYSFIDYEHTERFCGKSSYNIKSLIKHAIKGVLFQTSAPLKLIASLGFVISLIGFYFAIYIMYRYCFYDVMPGWSSSAVLISLIGGAIMSSLGIVGLYIARIFEQVKNRPLYIAESEV